MCSTRSGKKSSSAEPDRPEWSLSATVHGQHLGPPGHISSPRSGRREAHVAPDRHQQAEHGRLEGTLMAAGALMKCQPGKLLALSLSGKLSVTLANERQGQDRIELHAKHRRVLRR